MSRTQYKNIFTQAVFPSPVWEATLRVIKFFKDGQLKAQKLTKGSLIIVLTQHPANISTRSSAEGG